MAENLAELLDKGSTITQCAEYRRIIEEARFFELSQQFRSEVGNRIGTGIENTVVGAILLVDAYRNLDVVHMLKPIDNLLRDVADNELSFELQNARRGLSIIHNSQYSNSENFRAVPKLLEVHNASILADISLYRALQLSTNNQQSNEIMTIWNKSNELVEGVTNNSNLIYTVDWRNPSNPAFERQQVPGLVFWNILGGYRIRAHKVKLDQDKKPEVIVPDHRHLTKYEGHFAFKDYGGIHIRGDDVFPVDSNDAVLMNLGEPHAFKPTKGNGSTILLFYTSSNNDNPLGYETADWSLWSDITQTGRVSPDKPNTEIYSVPRTIDIDKAVAEAIENSQSKENHFIDVPYKGAIFRVVGVGSAEYKPRIMTEAIFTVTSGEGVVNVGPYATQVKKGELFYIPSSIAKVTKIIRKEQGFTLYEWQAPLKKAA